MTYVGLENAVMVYVDTVNSYNDLNSLDDHTLKVLSDFGIELYLDLMDYEDQGCGDADYVDELFCLLRDATNRIDDVLLYRHGY